MDLNDLRYFALIVEHGGFTAAERLTHITKSKLSRRIALLEERLGVRLLQRSTRRLAVTDAGRAFYEHCAAIVVEADAARDAIEQLRGEPAGTVRMTCAASMAQAFVTRIVAEYMCKYPKVRVELDATDRVVNLVEERVDIALRARFGSIAEPGLVARRLASGRLILVASPEYLAGRPPILDPSDLAEHATIGGLRYGAEQTWSLVASDGRTQKVQVQPRLLCSDFVVQHQAALGGIGVALVPLRLTWAGLDEQTLVRVAKEWSSPETDIHVVYPSRRGMLPSVRMLVEHLAERVPVALVS
ncbi:MAG TPA: LysR substrate-binding domain-containing protein [Rudaea sp.]|nr:LysR substrate-binding domain-containing protein [Rudaea sp.]